MSKYKHETVKQSVTDCNRLGNSAKMREALEKALEGIKTLSKTHNDDLPEDVCVILGRIAFDATEALSAPPRNCDVGTAEDQAERFHSFCKSNKQPGDVYSCDRCKLNSIEDCELAWAQMPYEEGGAE